MDENGLQTQLKNQKPNPILKFVVTVISDFALWFSRGLGSCASSVIGFFLVSAAILSVITAMSGEVSLPSDELKNLNQEVFRDYGGSDKIAYVDLSGVILEGDASDPFGTALDSITPEKVENIFDEIRKDEEIKAVVLYVNSPGGSAVASDRIYEVITDFKTDKKLPVIVLMGDVAASGGYYISSPADYIMANPATITGSIGVIMESYNLKGLYEKIGVKKETFKAGEFKDVLNDSRDVTPEERKILEGVINDAYEMFLQRVSIGRGMTLEELRPKAEGKIYSGSSAKEAGLVDGVGTLNDTLKVAADKAGITKYKVVKIKSTNIWDELLYNLKSGTVLIKAALGISIEPQFKVMYKLP